MDGSSRQTTRGNRFFLPKIEYSKIDTHSKLTPDFDLTSHCDGVENDEEIKRFEIPSNTTSERTAASFTKFSVLPPIRHRSTTKGKYLRDLQKTRSDDRCDAELELDGRRRSISLRRQTALWNGERDGTTNLNTGGNDLRIIGQRYIGGSSHIKGENVCMFARRPSSTPHLSPTADFTTAQHEDLQRMHKFTKFKRFHSESFKDKNPVQQNSGTFNFPNDNLSTLLVHVNDSKRKVSTSGLQVDFAPNRPVSRCHIDINVAEAQRTSEQNDKKQQLSSEQETNNQHTMSRTASPPIPMLQIPDEAETNNNNDNNINNNNNNNDSGPPSIQILIDTLETAKKQIPDKLELPKMSVREQRRRSALCRVNSKQVDDFLLVHNLKDLGLL